MSRPGIDPIQTVGDELTGGAVQLGGELDAGSTRADDGDVQLPLAQRVGLSLGAQQIVEEALLQAVCLTVIVEIDAVLGHAGDAEVVGDAADRNHQGVVGKGPARHQLLPGGIGDRRQADFLACPIEAVHAPLDEAEVVRLGMAEIV